MARPLSALTKFVLSLPRNLSAKEVIARAKTNGLKTTEHNVYRIRGSFGPKLAKKSPTKAAAPSKPAAPVTSNAKPALSKSAFIRSQPATLSASEVVAKAKTEGIKLGWRYVYNVRATDKASRKAKRAATKVTVSTPTSVNGVQPSTPLPAALSSAENLLRAVAAELGLGRAVEILAGERARVQAVLRG